MAPGGSKTKSNKENIFLYLVEMQKDCRFGVRPNGTDICSQYWVLMEGGIPAMADDDVGLPSTMLSSVV